MIGWFLFTLSKYGLLFINICSEIFAILSIAKSVNSPALSIIFCLNLYRTFNISSFTSPLLFSM